MYLRPFKNRGTCLYRLKVPIKQFCLPLSLSVPRSDRNIKFKSFSSPGQRFFNSAIACYSLFKVLVIT